MAKVIQEEREYTRKRIVEVAHIHFLRNGYEKTSLRAIAKEVGIGTSTIYGYFEKKTDLLIYTFLDLLNLQGKQLSSYLSLWNGEMTAESLADMITSMIMVQLQPLFRIEKPLLAQFFQAVSEELQFRELRDTMQPFGGVREAVNHVLQQCVDAGKLKTKLELEFLTEVLLETSAGHIFTYIFNSDFSTEHLRLLVRQTFYVILVDKM